MNKVTEDLLKIVSDYSGSYDGAYNIREDCQSVARRSTEHIKIDSKTDAPGLIVTVLPGTKGEKVYIPACVTKAKVEDLVYNDFIIGENADVVIVAGCGVHTDSGEEARHNGIHRFFLAKGAKVLYEEKHIGTGAQNGNRVIDPVTEAELGEGSSLTMDTSQLGGVSRTDRRTKVKMKSGARLEIRERILTDGDERAKTSFEVEINGEDAGVNLISRSVAKGESYQEYHSTIVGNEKCTGHSECDAILADNGRVSASPSLIANHRDAALIHEAAIGKIAGEQILKLCTLGLTEKEAEATIVSGFLR
jgi:Fe-S cluster assembly scaffold protein SufB